MALAAIAVTACTPTNSVIAPQEAPTPKWTESLVSSLPPAPTAGQWAPEVTNPYFPLRRGTTFTYRGVRDGEPYTQTVVVQMATERMAGASATVVLDTIRTSTHVSGTQGWYAQDQAGNVWYLGEAVRTFDKAGRVTSTTITWQAGDPDARPGLFMPAAPKVGDSFYQEYTKGAAEDIYSIASVDATLTVPYGAFTSAVLTYQTSELDMQTVLASYYAKGVGLVYQSDLTGVTDYRKLVSVTHK